MRAWDELTDAGPFAVLACRWMLRSDDQVETLTTRNKVRVAGCVLMMMWMAWSERVGVVYYYNNTVLYYIHEAVQRRLEDVPPGIIHDYPWYIWGHMMYVFRMRFQRKCPVE